MVKELLIPCNISFIGFFLLYSMLFFLVGQLLRVFLVELILSQIIERTMLWWSLRHPWCKLFAARYSHHLNQVLLWVYRSCNIQYGSKGALPVFHKFSNFLGDIWFSGFHSSLPYWNQMPKWKSAMRFMNLSVWIHFRCFHYYLTNLNEITSVRKHGRIFHICFPFRGIREIDDVNLSLNNMNSNRFILVNSSV